MVKEEAFATCTVVIPDTGGLVIKVPKRFRPAMEPWCLLAQQYHQVQQFAGPMLARDLPQGRAACVVCKVAPEAGCQQEAALHNLDLM
eukprot:3482116-Heterocapsa_arctica.AAC.1